MKGNTGSISVLGLGYVGLCTATTFAASGFKTLGIDIDTERIEKIRAGKAPFHEPQLDNLLKTVVKTKRLEVTNRISDASSTDTTFITVGTPSRRDGSIDLTQVKKAAQELGTALHNKPTYHLVIVKSTVIPGTTSSTVKPALETASGKTIGGDLGLCANPEFLKEGSAIHDALHPDKIVIGTADKKSAKHLKRLYQRFYKGRLPHAIITTPETAEMIKYASNAFLATKVSFINTIANICQQIPGVDVDRVAEAIGLDPRIGPLFLKAGPGYGGSCFHKDLQALVAYSRSLGYNPALLQATEDVNEQQASKVVDLSMKLLGSLQDKRVAVLGLAFKKGTDDVREAASVRIIQRLSERGAQVIAYDPMAIPNAKKVLSRKVEYAEDPYSAIKEADCSIIMTEWDEIRKLRPKDYTLHMRTPNIVDARKLYDPADFKDVNFEAIGLGVDSPPVTPLTFARGKRS